MALDPSNYKDRQLILRCFLSAGDTPSPELIQLAPETFAAVLADPQTSARDRIRAAEAIVKLQQLQLQAVATVDKIKARRQRNREAQAVREQNAPDPVPRHLLAMLDMLNEDDK